MSLHFAEQAHKERIISELAKLKLELEHYINSQILAEFWLTLDEAQKKIEEISCSTS